MEPKDILQLESSDERQAYLFEENCRLQTQGARCLRSNQSGNRSQCIGKVFHHTV